MEDVVQNLVSTIIPAYDRPEMLREAVESVLAQTYRPVEVIVSDDGSTDDAVAAADALARAHPDVVRVIHGPHRGPGPAREAGRQLARGEFIQYLDSDDRLLPRKFAVQVGALRAHPDCGAAYGFIRLCPEGEPPRAEPYKWSGRALPTLFPDLLVDRWWNTDCPLFRRSVTDAVGPWTDLRYSQDWEYDARVGALGTRLVQCPEFVCEQRQHAQARQTGHGAWLDPPDRVRFFTLLHAHACRAGVPPASAHMRHFSRWVFSQARQCGALGDAAAARRLYALAASAVPEKDMTLRAVGWAARLLGWRLTGRLCAARDRFAGGRAGADSRRQSWMAAESARGQADP